MLIKIPLDEIDLNNIEETIHKRIGKDILRWGGINYQQDTNSLLFEAYPCSSHSSLPTLETIDNKFSEKRVGLHVIPTGIGCSIGGYGGDANLVNNLLSDEFDYLIVNPNVTNGGAWQNLSANILYVEGAAIDLFMQSKIALRARNKNKIGVVFDKSFPEEIRWKELQTIKSAETIWGIDFIGYEVTEEFINPKIEVLDGGYSSGYIENTSTLFNASTKLVEKGAEAIAILTYWNNELNELDKNYIDGEGPDPIGGIEAILSHIITRNLLIPCAHAPSFPFDIDKDNYCQQIDPRVSPEIASYSFLPSVLRGLSKAPQLIKKDNIQIGDISVCNLDSFIGPKDCWAGSSFISSLNTPNLDCYAVQSNQSKIAIQPGLFKPAKQIFKPHNYLELIGYLKAKSKGIKLKTF